MTEAIWVAVIGAVGIIVAAAIKVFVPSQNEKTRERKNSFSRPIKDAVAQVYLTVLERSVDSDGLAIYAGQLQRKEKTLRLIVKEIGESDEYFDNFVRSRSPRDAVILLYRHFLCRDPENEEIISEHIHLLATKDWKYVVDKLVNSDEYTSRFGEHSPPHRS